MQLVAAVLDDQRARCAMWRRECKACSTGCMQARGWKLWINTCDYDYMLIGVVAYMIA